MFSWISVMLRNIHFGGALSGIAANRCSQSTSPRLGSKTLGQNPTPASSATVTMSFFMSSSCFQKPTGERGVGPTYTAQIAPSGAGTRFGSAGFFTDRGRQI